MGNEFSDTAYGRTEREACMNLVSAITTMYPTKVTRIYLLDKERIIERTDAPPRFLRIEPYGDYKMIYKTTGNGVIASVKFDKATN